MLGELIFQGLLTVMFLDSGSQVGVMFFPRGPLDTLKVVVACHNCVYLCVC